YFRWNVMFVRTAVLVLITLVAMLPPGMCPCRFANAAAPIEHACPCHEGDDDYPDDGDDHDGCSCPEVKAIAITPTDTHISAAESQAQALQGDSVTLTGQRRASALAVQGADPPLHAPIYLTVRALLL